MERKKEKEHRKNNSRKDYIPPKMEIVKTPAVAFAVSDCTTGMGHSPGSEYDPS